VTRALAILLLCAAVSLTILSIVGHAGLAFGWLK
jgi:hypothetical protein